MVPPILVAAPVPGCGDGATASADSESVCVEGKALLSAVPQVVEAIGQISNYFGASAEHSSMAEPAGQQATPGQSYKNAVSCEIAGQQSGESGEEVGVQSANSTTIGQLSHDVIGRLAGEIAQHLQGGSEKVCQAVVMATEVPISAAPDKCITTDADEVPSYAPERCIATDAGYGTREDIGTHGNSALSALDAAKDGNDEVSKLEGILVSEKDIFGGPMPKDNGSDNDDDAVVEEGFDDAVEMGEGLDDAMEMEEGLDDAVGMGEGLGEVTCGQEHVADGDNDGGNHGDGNGAKDILSSSQAEMMEAFKKLTSEKPSRKPTC